MTEAEWLAGTDPAAMLRLRRADCCGCFWMDNNDRTVSLASGAKPCYQCDNGPVRPRPVASNRKLRLWASACWRVCPPRNLATGWLNALDELEEVADGHQEVFSWPSQGYICATVNIADMLRLLSGLWLGENLSEQWHRNAQVCCGLLRTVVGNPFKVPPIMWHAGQPYCNPRKPKPWPEPNDPVHAIWASHAWEMCPWLAHADGRVPKLAQVIYDERRWSAMPMLADALEESGCEDETILRHCRGQRRCIGCTRRLEPNCICRGTGWLPMDKPPAVGPHVRGDWCLDLLLGKE